MNQKEVHSKLTVWSMWRHQKFNRNNSVSVYISDRWLLLTPGFTSESIVCGTDDETKVTNTHWQLDKDVSELICVRMNRKDRVCVYRSYLAQVETHLWDAEISPLFQQPNIHTSTTALSFETIESSSFCAMNHAPHLSLKSARINYKSEFWTLKKSPTVGSTHYLTSQEVSPGAPQTHICIVILCCTAVPICQHMTRCQDSLEKTKRPKQWLHLQLWNTVCVKTD